MHENQLAGTHEELGRAYGEFVAERKLNWWWQEPSRTKLEFVKACEQAVAEYAPASSGDAVRNSVPALHRWVLFPGFRPRPCGVRP